MKIRKELWFGFILMALIIAGTALMLIMAPKITNGHLGLMMLALVVGKTLLSRSRVSRMAQACEYGPKYRTPLRRGPR